MKPTVNARYQDVNRIFPVKLRQNINGLAEKCQTLSTGSGDIPFGALYAITGDRIGRHDAACPLCGPSRKTKANQIRRTLRVWVKEPGFASYQCARCGAAGWARSGDARKISADEVARQQQEADKAAQAEAEKRRNLALYLWRRAMPITGTIANVYMAGRGITCELPQTLRFLPSSRSDRHPAMIAAFGFAHEIEPGRVAIRDAEVRGVHLTMLKPDGSGKADVDPPKIMIGRSQGAPIVLAPANDLLALTVTEGIEDALSLHQATGIGAWAAGAAGRIPALIEAIPTYTERLLIATDPDDAGNRAAIDGLATARRRGIVARRLTLEATP